MANSPEDCIDHILELEKIARSYQDLGEGTYKALRALLQADMEFVHPGLSDLVLDALTENLIKRKERIDNALEALLKKRGLAGAASEDMER